MIWVSKSKPKLEEYSEKFDDFTQEQFQSHKYQSEQDPVLVIECYLDLTIMSFSKRVAKNVYLLGNYQNGLQGDIFILNLLLHIILFMMHLQELKVFWIN